jgi:hypothetical protein
MINILFRQNKTPDATGVLIYRDNILVDYSLDLHIEHTTFHEMKMDGLNPTFSLFNYYSYDIHLVTEYLQKYINSNIINYPHLFRA